MARKTAPRRVSAYHIIAGIIVFTILIAAATGVAWLVTGPATRGEPTEPVKSPAYQPSTADPVKTPEEHPAYDSASEAKIAIIIDDVGNELGSLETLLAVPVPLTFSVLPHAARTAESLRMLERSGAEVMLHLPMQPASHPETYPGDGALLLSMDEGQIKTKVEEALAKVPGAMGVNNHMGSAFTADARCMRAVLGVLRERGLFFVDSRTTAQTKGHSMALRMGVPAAERSVFLDNHQDTSSIMASLLALGRTAELEGEAIGIGHPYPETVAVLQEKLPQMKAAGYHFVHASELVK